MTSATIIRFPRKPRRSETATEAVSEAKARLVLAVIRSEKLMDELEQIDRELDAILRDNPRVMK